MLVSIACWHWCAAGQGHLRHVCGGGDPRGRCAADRPRAGADHGEALPAGCCVCNRDRLSSGSLMEQWLCSCKFARLPTAGSHLQPSRLTASAPCIVSQAFKAALGLTDVDAAPVHIDVGRRILRGRMEAGSRGEDIEVSWPDCCALFGVIAGRLQVAASLSCCTAAACPVARHAGMAASLLHPVPLFALCVPCRRARRSRS